ncbi:MAG TPA: GSCFA domain protein, partial [Rikenellaceae bacterium]|nr:GSCFA domain protein [Rikenellaceae bacterium]
MVKLYTEVRVERRNDISITLSDRILMLGSCFSDEIGDKLLDAGFEVLCNPFGTL